MSNTRFLRADGRLDVPMSGRATAWLPALDQITAALQFRLADALGEEIVEGQSPEGRTTTMRQGLGLVLLCAILAGALPFITNWLMAGRAGTALPMLTMARMATVQSEWWDSVGLPGLVIADAFQQAAGLQPTVPGWMAAGFSSFGGWINLILTFLTQWIACGAGVLLMAHLFGATTTLQRFFAATSYAFLPLILTMFAPLPCVGPLGLVVGWLWAFLLYLNAVRSVTGLETTQTVISVLTPVALYVLLLIFSAGLVAASLWSTL